MEKSKERWDLGLDSPTMAAASASASASASSSSEIKWELDSALRKTLAG